MHEAEYRIYYEDTDAGGVVYYANYLKFFERARTDFLRELSISQSTLAQEENLVFVVRKCQIEYKSPARLDDLVKIKTTITKVGGAFITMHQEMECEGNLLNILDCEIVCANAATMKPTRIPTLIKSKFNV